LYKIKPRQDAKQNEKKDTKTNETTQVKRICEKLSRGVGQDEPNAFTKSKDNTRQ